jgi:hypothetical protein
MDEFKWYKTFHRTLLGLYLCFWLIPFNFQYVREEFELYDWTSDTLIGVHFFYAVILMYIKVKGDQYIKRRAIKFYEEHGGYMNYKFKD